jgi:hypothetical protein
MLKGQLGIFGIRNPYFWHKKSPALMVDSRGFVWLNHNLSEMLINLWQLGKKRGFLSFFGLPPVIIHFNVVFSFINQPFGGTLPFMETPI